MTVEVETQEANIQPPRRGEGVAVTVTTISNTYDLKVLSWNGKEHLPQLHGYVFLDIQNDGANPLYYRFGSTNDNDLNEATVQAAGSTLARVAAVPKLLPAGQERAVRLQLDKDTFLSLKSTGGNTVLRIFPSSDSSTRVG